MNSVDHLFRQLKSPSEADYSVAVRILEKIETCCMASVTWEISNLIEAKDKRLLSKVEPTSLNFKSGRDKSDNFFLQSVYHAFADFMTWRFLDKKIGVSW